MTSKPARILVVDDHESNRYRKSRTLRHAGFEVLEAGNGGDALELTAAHVPDLVVLDTQLPDINGFEVASRMAANGNAPAVVLTSSRDVDDLGPLADYPHVRGFIPKSELSGAALEALL